MQLPVGAAVTIDVELQYQGQRVPGFAADFAMPMHSSAVMSDSKRWEVTRELIRPRSTIILC